jgi:hypothetical protein
MIINYSDGLAALGDALSDCYGACAANSEGALPEDIQACYSTCGSIYGGQVAAVPAAVLATGAKPATCAWYQAMNTTTKQCELGGSLLIASIAVGGVFLFTFGGGR